jgi:aryl-alcohol dehydrogenase-like predicted oxidoreductase
VVDLAEVSAVGFGAYRVVLGDRQHESALRHALDRGCNLVDTAPSYGAGRSEALIGKVLKDDDRPRPFVITKAGYRHAGDSLEPSALRRELASSRERLQVRSLDGVLLHNPELWLEEPSGVRDVELAFAVLEEEVDRGRLSAFGVSTTVEPARLLLQLRHRLALRHFEILEIPFNLVETGAVLEGDEPSILRQAHASGLRVIANRPLNAITANGLLRLALDDRPPAIAVEGRARAVQDALDLIETRLARTQAGRDVAVVAYLRAKWRDLPTVEAAEAIVATHLAPLLRHLWPDAAPPEQELATIRRLQRSLLAQARDNMTTVTCRFRAELVASGQLDVHDPRPLALVACERVLEAGFDHVVVGMRRRRYVDDLRPLLPGATTVGGTREAKRSA